MLASDSNDIKGTTNITSNYVITAALPISSLGQQRLQATFVAEINVDFSTKSVCVHKTNTSHLECTNDAGRQIDKNL